MERDEICFKPIGVVRTGCSDDHVRENSGYIEGYVEIFREFEQALHGIESYSHIFIISYLHKSPPKRSLLIKPRKMLKLGLSPDEVPTIGSLASDSPQRPNPIGLTLVRLKGREGNKLYVYGLDLFDGTPVLDLKPYRKDYECHEYVRPKWVELYDERKELI